MWRVFRRIQPWIGVVLLGLGGFVGLLALSKGDLKAAAPALVAFGGASLIGRATFGLRRWLFVIAGLGAAVGLYFATAGPH